MTSSPSRRPQRRAVNLDELAAACGLLTLDERDQHERNTRVIQLDLAKRFEIDPAVARQAAEAAYKVLLEADRG